MVPTGVRYARLEGREIVPCTMLEWASNPGGLTTPIARHVGDSYAVSTVFLGLNHSFLEGRPTWFETMVFAPGGSPVYQDRYTTFDKAIEGHMSLVRQYEPTAIQEYLLE